MQAILDDEGELSEAQVRTCMRQILLALEFMHKKSIAHLDLKLSGGRREMQDSNVLWDRTHTVS